MLHLSGASFSICQNTEHSNAGGLHRGDKPINLFKSVARQGLSSDLALSWQKLLKKIKGADSDDFDSLDTISAVYSRPKTI